MLLISWRKIPKGCFTSKFSEVEEYLKHISLLSGYSLSYLDIILLNLFWLCLRVKIVKVRKRLFFMAVALPLCCGGLRSTATFVLRHFVKAVAASCCYDLCSKATVQLRLFCYYNGFAGVVANFRIAVANEKIEAFSTLIVS